MTNDRQAWYCPSCRTYHAPHCDTCPEPVPAWTPWGPVMLPQYDCPACRESGVCNCYRPDRYSWTAWAIPDPDAGC